MSMFEFLFKRWMKPISFRSASVTDRGLARPDNQDSCLELPRRLFWCVADGMGGGQGGALASAWTCEALRSVFADAVPFPRLLRSLADAVGTANDRIRAYAREKSFRSMGCTVVGVVCDRDRDGRAAVFHAGDSRLYRLRCGRLQALTSDHTIGHEVGRAMPADSQLRSMASRRNPLSHVLTRAIGTEFRVRLEWHRVDVARGDRYLLCSDGVHDMLSDGELLCSLRRSSTPEEAVNRIAEDVRLAGAGDNYTIVCIFVN